MTKDANPPENWPSLLPIDAHNLELIANAHPQDWQNPKPAPRYNLVVIGGGTAGLVCAAGAAGLGAKVALVEKNLLGGDCLNFGCVPSKALIRASRAAHAARNAAHFGIETNTDASVNFGSVMERVRSLRAKISHHDSAARFQSLGVDVFLGSAQFISGDTVEVAGEKLNFSKAVICTGARAALPPIPGLADVDCLSNETVFNLRNAPSHLLVLGGGPIGCELAQAFQRLGVQVTLVEMAERLLPREDSDAARVVLESLRRDGVKVLLSAKIESIEVMAGTKRVKVLQNNAQAQIDCDALLVSTGRKPNVEGMNLEGVGVAYDDSGVKVDDYLRTSNPRIFAAGDICMRQQFTHAADAAARIVLRNALFPFLPKARVSKLLIPWCMYTSPELAQVGLREDEAKALGHCTETINIPMKENDRAILDAETDGFLKVCLQKRSGRLLGATFVSAHAGESIGEITLAIRKGVRLGELSSLIHPYPTQAEAIKRAGDAYMRTRLSPRIASLLRWYLNKTR